MIHELRRSFALETEHAAVRMIGVGFETNDFPVLNRRDGRAMRRAQSAKSARRGGGLRGIQHGC